MKMRIRRFNFSGIFIQTIFWIFMNSYAIFILIENKVNERKILSYALDFYIFQEQLALFVLN